MTTSQLLTGSTTPPRIRDIAVTNAAHDSVNFTYKIQSHLPDTEAGIYVNGALTGRVPGTESTASASNLLPGTHSLDIIPLQPSQRAPQRQGFTIGDRVYLEWDASESPYTASYTIYRDATVIGTVTDRQVYPLDFYTTSAGGRVSVFGYPSTAVNDSFTVVVTGSTFTFDGTTYTWQTGSPVSLPYGVMIIFHDDPGEYTNFNIFVGVENHFLTDSQTPGTYTYSVVATDTAGNVSLSLSKTIRVIELPAIPTVDNAALTGSGRVRIYTDYNPVFGTHDTYINTDTPYETLTLPASTTIPVGSRFYAFPITADGVELEYLQIHSVVDPLAPTANLSVPADVALAPAIDGNMTFTFTYRPDDATLFRVYYGTDPASLISETTILSSTGVGGPTKTYTVTLPALYLTGTVVYAQARAETATVNGELSDIASATAVADDPVLIGTLYGVTT